MPDATAAGPVAPTRNNRQLQNNRASHNAPSVPPQKNGLKRASTDDVVEVPNPSTTPVQRPVSQQAPQVSGPVPQQIPQLDAAQLARLGPDQRAKYEAMLQKSRQLTAGGGAIGEEMRHLRAIGQEEHISAAKEPYVEIPMTPEQYKEMALKIQTTIDQMNKVSKILGRWYTHTKDDNRARMFFKIVSLLFC